MTFRLFSAHCGWLRLYHTLAVLWAPSHKMLAPQTSDDNVPIVSGMRCLAAHLPLAQCVVPGTTLHSRSERAEGTLTISVCVRFADRHFFVPTGFINRWPVFMLPSSRNCYAGLEGSVCVWGLRPMPTTKGAPSSHASLTPLLPSYS